MPRTLNDAVKAGIDSVNLTMQGHSCHWHDGKYELVERHVVEYLSQIFQLYYLEHSGTNMEVVLQRLWKDIRK